MANLLDSPIYLHFLDRELRNSIKSKLTQEQILNFLDVAIFLTSGQLYLNNSLLWENIVNFPKVIDYILELEKIDETLILSNHSTLDEFLISRRRLYIKDKERYPMYFSDSIEDKPWGSSPIILKDSTTGVLEKNLKNLVDREIDEQLGQICKKLNLSRNLYEILEGGLNNRNGQAITFNLFKDLVNDKMEDQIQGELLIRKLISLLYTRRYLNILGGTLLTGLGGGFHVFDSLSLEEEFYNYQIHRVIFARLGVIPFNSVDSLTRLINIYVKKKNILFKHFLSEVRKFINGCISLKEKEFLDRDSRLIHIKKYTNDVFADTLLDFQVTQLEQSYIKLISINKRLMCNPLFGEGYQKMKELDFQKRVLIVTATLTELQVLLKVIEERKISYERFTIGSHTYFTLGKLGNNEVYVFKTGMGSIGTRGSTLSISDAVKAINPDYIIMVGVAFGLKKDKQNLGDILVSQQLLSYESEKITENGEIPRGDKVTASTLLIDRFETSSLNWSKKSKANVQFGLILSGEKLVNSQSFIKKLLLVEPEAIGGEMEGSGLLAVCQSDKRDWILVKAICDWGYEKESDYQLKAAANSIEFALDTITYYLD